MISDSSIAIESIARGLIVSPDIETTQVMEWLKSLVDENRTSTDKILAEVTQLRIDFTAHKGNVGKKFAEIESKIRFRNRLVMLIGAAIPLIGIIIFKILEKSL